MGKSIVICGPTATGKTDLAIKLARDLAGELINFDSRQIYKDMNIGTNKGKIKSNGQKLEIGNYEIEQFLMENSKEKAWLFDFILPNQEFSLAEYIKLEKYLESYLYNLAKIPIIVGGTGLYLDAIYKGYQIPKVLPNLNLRKELNSKSTIELQEILKNIAPKVYSELNNSDLNNYVRLIRLIEIKSEKKVINRKELSKNSNQYLFIYPKFDRQQLYSKINYRVEELFNLGLVDEVKKLLSAGFQEARALQGIGYKEVIELLNEEIDLETCKEQIKQHHRNYAARQITWFEGKGRNYPLNKFDFDSDYQKILTFCKEFLTNQPAEERS